MLKKAKKYFSREKEFDSCSVTHNYQVAIDCFTLSQEGAIIKLSFSLAQKPPSIPVLKSFLKVMNRSGAI